MAMTVVDQDTGEIYARHTIAEGRQKLVSLPHADRELSKRLPGVYKQVLDCFEAADEAEKYLLMIKTEKPRYFKDQLNVILKTCEQSSSQKMRIDALTYCIQNQLYSADEFKAAMAY